MFKYDWGQIEGVAAWLQSEQGWAVLSQKQLKERAGNCTLVFLWIKKKISPNPGGSCVQKEIISLCVCVNYPEPAREGCRVPPSMGTSFLFHGEPRNLHPPLWLPQRSRLGFSGMGEFSFISIYQLQQSWDPHGSPNQGAGCKCNVLFAPFFSGWKLRSIKRGWICFLVFWRLFVFVVGGGVCLFVCGVWLFVCLVFF